MKKEPHSEPNFTAQYGIPAWYQNVAKDVGEKVAEKYRRRASIDVDELRPPGLKSTQASINEKLSSSPREISAEIPSADRRKSLPAKIPRKLRPIFPQRQSDNGFRSQFRLKHRR